MEVRRWIVPEPVERLPALFLALIATATIFGAINVGFAPQAGITAGQGWQQAAMPAGIGA
jgi:hypothetical protein